MSSAQFSRRVALKLGATAFAGGAALFPRISGQALEKITIALDWYPNANHAGLFIARDAGAFEEAGYEVDVYTPSDPTVVLQTVGVGKDTFGISYQTDVLLARAQGVPVVSVAALVQHPLVCVMSLASAGIARPADLKGRTIGYPGIPSQEAYLSTMLETDGLTMNDVTLVNVEFNLVPAVISGQADAVIGAYWTHETILAEREGYPVSIMRVENWGVPDFYELVLVASEDTVANRGEMVRAVLAAIQGGYNAAISHPDAALEILVATYPEIDREVEAEGLALLVPVWRPDGRVFGEQLPARWDTYGAWMKSVGLIPEDLDITAAYRAEFLPTATATPSA